MDIVGGLAACSLSCLFVLDCEDQVTEDLGKE
jgi:hypothetical protein